MTKVQKLLTALMFTTTLATAQTIVTVNGKAITVEEIKEKLMMATQGRPGQISPQKQNQLFNQFIQKAVEDELVYDAANKSKIQNTAEYKKQYKALLERMQKQLAIQVWKQKLFENIKVSDKDLKKYYNSNKAEFEVKGGVHTRHILVDSEDKAKAMILQLKPLSGKKLETKFAQLARENSSCPSKAQGGDLGVYTKSSQIFPEYKAAIFKMKEGSISNVPVKSQAGYHVIYLQEKVKASVTPFNKVKELIKLRIKKEKFQEIYIDTITALQKKATIIPAKNPQAR